MAKPFRFMTRLPDITETMPKWRDEVARIEGAGFSTVFVPDHFTDGSVVEPTVALTAAAMTSERLRVLCMVHGNDYRHPVMLHHAAANLDVVSEGRLELGLGAGWMVSDYEQAGLPYDPPGVRVSRLEESVKVIKGLFGEKPFSFEGEYLHIHGLDGIPKPVQKPHPPIVIGAGGRRMLSLAAREADIVGVNANLKAGVIGPDAAADFMPDRIDEKIGWVRVAAEAAGRSIDDIELQVAVFMCRVTETTAEADDVITGMAPMFGVEPEVAAQSPTVLIGPTGALIERLQERRERWGFSYVGLSGDLDQIAPIVAALSGT